MPFADTWMDLEVIIPSEASQKGKINTLWYHQYVESKIQMNTSRKQNRLTDIENRLVVAGKEGGEGRMGVWD